MTPTEHVADSDRTVTVFDLNISKNITYRKIIYIFIHHTINIQLSLVIRSGILYFVYIHGK